MSSLDQAVETQLVNIQKKTGKSLAELAAFIQSGGKKKHSELRQMVIQELGLGYGDANTLVHYAMKSDGAGQTEAKGLDTAGVLDDMYAGPKAALRPINDRLMAAIEGFGSFEIVPKKGYVSLRRKKQFAMIGPATKTRVEVGLNVKDLEPAERIIAQPAGGMCNYKVNLTAPEQVDDELISWIRRAYDSAG